MTFRELSIVVGKNNAGKSTLIEALRLIALVSNRYKNLSYVYPPEGIRNFVRHKGVRPSIEGLDFAFETLSNNYDTDNPSIIRAFFDNGSRIEVYLNKDKNIHSVIFDRNGRVVRSRSDAAQVSIPQINILPQIGPLRREESLLGRDYVVSRRFSYLSSEHFRNQLQVFYDNYFDRFTEIVKNTWGEEVSVLSFDRAADLLNDSEKPRLWIKDGVFVVEVGYVGNGLQMWLQILWFISQCASDSVVILDEPDVYLHADMQRKLIRFLKNRFKQAIVATHSVDIMGEVNPEDILIVNRSNYQSKFATSSAKVQAVVNNFGSFHNIELVRFWSSKKVVFTEGRDDYKILTILYSKLGDARDTSLADFPNFPTEGWSGWQKVIGGKTIIDNGGVSMKMYCLFDSDYRSQHELSERKIAAAEKGINLHIWKCKEIENYLISPEAITRLIQKSNPDSEVSNEIVSAWINETTSGMKEFVVDKYSDAIQVNNRGWTPSQCRRAALDIVTPSWSNTDYRIERIPGKKLITQISDWSQNKFNVSLNAWNIAEEMLAEEISPEIANVINSIVESIPFAEQ